MRFNRRFGLIELPVALSLGIAASLLVHIGRTGIGSFLVGASATIAVFAILNIVKGD